MVKKKGTLSSYMWFTHIFEGLTMNLQNDSLSSLPCVNYPKKQRSLFDSTPAPKDSRRKGIKYELLSNIEKLHSQQLAMSSLGVRDE
ncbi:hypothetical protein ACU8KH_02249 [Lachancea thermotolerans]